MNRIEIELVAIIEGHTFTERASIDPCYWASLSADDRQALRRELADEHYKRAQRAYRRSKRV